MEDFVRNSGLPSGYAPYCKPCHNARGKLSRDKVGGSRTYHLKRRYGITAEDADAMLAEQDGLCAICGVAPAAHVDHDHVTGAVRQLLCFNCNGGLGQFKDDPELLHRAAYYVALHTARQQVAAELAADRTAFTADRPGEPPTEPRRPPSARPGGRTRSSRKSAAEEA
ncbi:endonuclease VII domain-containing protein [Petropleomorpha daqingensis]|uniref:endonuclease VII domain-containing protein n=1 Tax=Petropleomorpha daqingensis TaxID=2026353 RepID=UPI001FE7B886|nr:endonuclease VII domain-containing protein [Petropleomorpha daqingensis]